MTKNYKAAPLPFIGQKRLFLKDFKAMLAEIEGDGEGWSIVDVFGGSGSRSELPAYVDYLKKSRPHEWRHKFEGAVVKHRVGRVNASAAYKDNMIYNLQAV